MTTAPSFGELFRFLDDRLPTKSTTDPFQLVHDFTAIHGLDRDALISLLQSFGGYDDWEVLLNVVGRIPDESVIGMPVETADEVAHRLGFFCRKMGGRFVPCSREDPNAQPDLNRALATMGQENR